MFKSRRSPSPVFVEDEFYDHRRPKKLRLRYVLALIIVVVSVVYWQQAEATETENPSSDVTAGQLRFRSQLTGEYFFALPQDSTVHIKVSGLVAKVSVKQRFYNDSDDWVEGVYSFPLPDKSAVNRMRMVIGDRVIEGEIKEKSVAKKIYQQAKVAGKKASLLNQQRPNLFTTKVANIAPGETITVQLEYIEAVANDSGQFSLRFPMTITPRYIPGKPLQSSDEALTSLMSGDSGWAVNTDQVSDADKITAQINPAMPTKEKLVNPITITAELDMGMPLKVIESAYHSIVLSKQEDRYSLRLKNGRVAMEQDFVLTWRPLIGQLPKGAVFSEQINGEDYGLLMVVPPDQTGSISVLPKEVIYIIDTSGSMDGVSIKQAKQSLLFALEQLSTQDRFNIIEFNSTTSLVFDQLVSVDKNNLDYARRYVRGLQSRGGTEMLPALQAAFNDRVEEGFVRQVIFITDGAVGNEAVLFELINKQLGSSRLFTIGIGSAPNSHFMRKAAQFGRGTFMHIGEVSEVRQKMSELFVKLNSPIVSDIQISWPGGEKVVAYPRRIPDLYLGEPLVVSVKTADLRGVISVHGKTAGQPWEQRLLVKDLQSHSGVATLWAREKIESLLDEKTIGRDAVAVRKEVVDVALTHQLVTPYTSFVAVEKVVSRPESIAEKTRRVLNTRAKGQGAQTFAFPKTASIAMQSLLWGLLLILIAWIFKRCIDKEVEYGLLD